MISFRPFAMQRRMSAVRAWSSIGLVVGEGVRCESELSDVKMRSTRQRTSPSQRCVHCFFGRNGLAVVEEQDIIHMEPIARRDEEWRCRRGAGRGHKGVPADAGLATGFAANFAANLAARAGGPTP